MNLIFHRNMFRWHVNFLSITEEGIIQLVKGINVSNFENTFMLRKNKKNIWRLLLFVPPSSAEELSSTGVLIGMFIEITDSWRLVFTPETWLQIMPSQWRNSKHMISLNVHGKRVKYFSKLPAGNLQDKNDCKNDLGKKGNNSYLKRLQIRQAFKTKDRQNKHE